ncbi:MAG: hypothetical protein PWP27_1498 [Clostridiales bacterium]|nr:hypothetical protein [Clostridiales bacterium]
MSLYTMRGDQGFTDLYSGGRVSKSDIRIETVGTIDELTSHIGKAKALIINPQLKDELSTIQQELMSLMAVIVDSKGIMKSENFINKSSVEKLQQKIDIYQTTILHKNGFVLPGANPVSAQFDVARTVARRAERTIVKMMQEFKLDAVVLQYMNRLSDYLYTIARYMDFYEAVRKKIEKSLSEKKNMKENTNRMTLSTAKRIIEYVEQKAQSMGLSVVIAVVNREGNPVCVHVMDNSFLVSFEVALKKAFTAAALKMPTEKVGELTQPGADFSGLETALSHKIITLGGGVPIEINDQVIGAVGVSGGSAGQDIQLAQCSIEFAKEVF